MSYDPNKKVQELVEEFGPMGRAVLDAYNQVDPLQCYYGEDVNPDEYTSHARRFLEEFKTNSLRNAIGESFSDDELPGGQAELPDFKGIVKALEIRLGNDPLVCPTY